MKIAIIGATGLVGQELQTCLQERRHGKHEILLVATDDTANKSKGKILTIRQAFDRRPDYAFFAASNDVSEKWAQFFWGAGTRVIDKSEFFRQDSNVPLIIPEINGHLLTAEDLLVSTPNCATTQLVMVLAPLHKKYGLKRVIMTSMQSASGVGQDGLNQLEDERSGQGARKKVFPGRHRIYDNIIPVCGRMLIGDITSEEAKIREETQRLLDLPRLQISATAVRVPITIGHFQTVLAEFETRPDREEIKEMFGLRHTTPGSYWNTPGVQLEDKPLENVYPMPMMVRGADDILVGRFRIEWDAKGLSFCIAGNNLRKGAALNAVQIMEHLMKLRAAKA